MSMRIRCIKCRKKISVDEAFAGGMCRCPYCKEIVKVPDRGGTVGVKKARPSSPGYRPDAPGAHGGIRRDAATKVHVPNPDSIPMANPVMVQGIFALIMMGCLLIMIGVGAYAAYAIFIKPPPPPPPVQNTVEYANAFINKHSPGIAGDVQLSSPVVYAIDYGSRMREYVAIAEKLVEYSVKTFPAGAKFNLVRITGEEPKVVFGDYIGGGAEGAGKLIATEKPDADQISNVADGVKKALSLKPKSLVLLICRELNSDEASELARMASGQGTSITVLYITDRMASEEEANAMKPLIGSGGAFRPLVTSDLGNELMAAENQHK